MSSSLRCRVGLHRWRVTGFDLDGSRVTETCSSCQRFRERRTNAKEARHNPSDYNPW